MHDLIVIGSGVAGLTAAITAAARGKVALLTKGSLDSGCTPWAQGGIAVVVGNAREGEQLTLDPKQLNQGKQLRGTWGGDNLPDRDFPRYAKLIRCGKLDLTPILSEPLPLARVNEALEMLERGMVGRPLLRTDL